MDYIKATDFLTPFFPPKTQENHEPDSQYPFVTLTYAQSLDGKIASEGGKQLILSGEKSMIMTHRMRTLNDGILVGIGTVLNDDPQLSARLLPPNESQSPQPQPIILDTQLRFPLSAKLLRNYNNGTGKQPWILTTDVFSEEKTFRMKDLITGGANISILPNLRLPTVLVHLKSRLIHSLMIEGGAGIIKSCLSNPECLDLIVITIAPLFVGPGLSAINGEVGLLPIFKSVSWEPFGRDIVMAGKIS